jgi:hypothetical protein
MLEKCRRDQWKADDLDWSLRPRELAPEQERAVVQYFTNMSGIERLAGRLFAVQRDRARDPVLREIFSSFVVDEERHSEVAARLANHYNVRKLQNYEQHPNLVRFETYFVGACKYLSPEIANAYITTGELLLDIALLRSLDDYVDDEMSHQAMRLINRDESRHIAVDYHMVEFYSSEEHDRDLAERQQSLSERAKAAMMFAGMLYHARPFFHDVFFTPMDLTDPSGKRLLEAFRRVQLLSAKPGVARRPFTRFMSALQTMYGNRWIRPVFGALIERTMGLDPRVIRDLNSQAEMRRAERMSFDDLAAEALDAKTQN